METLNSHRHIATMIEAQAFVKALAQRNRWNEAPNIDKFDHLHEELIEMSKHLRYKSPSESAKYVACNKDIFVDGIGDLFFALCCLSNQLGIDIEEAFNTVKGNIYARYNGRYNECKPSEAAHLAPSV